MHTDRREISHTVLRELDRQAADVGDLMGWLEAQGVNPRALRGWSDRYAAMTDAIDEDEVAVAAMVGFEVGFRACLRQTEEALGL